MNWFEKIRQKSEWARFVMALASFIAISALVVFIAFFNAARDFQRSSIEKTAVETKSAIQEWYKGFQNFREKLGLMKKNLKDIIWQNVNSKKFLDSMSTYETDNPAQNIELEKVESAVANE